MTHQVILIGFQEPLASFLDPVTTVVSSFSRHQNLRLISSYPEECRTVADHLKRSVDLPLTMDSGWDPRRASQGLSTGEMRTISVSLGAENIETYYPGSYSEIDDSYQKRIKRSLFKPRYGLSVICVLPSVIQTSLSLLKSSQVSILPIYAQITIISSESKSEIIEVVSALDEFQRLIIPPSPLESTIEQLSKSFKEELDGTMLTLVEGYFSSSAKTFGRPAEEDAKNRLNLLTQKCAQIKDSLNVLHSGVDETACVQLRELGTRIDQINAGRIRLESDLGVFLSELDSVRSYATRLAQAWTDLKSEVSARVKPETTDRNLPIKISGMEQTAEGYVAQVYSKKHYTRPYELVLHGIEKKTRYVEVNGGPQQVKVADFGLAPGEYMIFFRDCGTGQHIKSNTFCLDISNSTPAGPSE